MRIVCPSCSAAYVVPDAMLVGRRAVRCASCASEFEPIAAELPAEPAPEAAAGEAPGAEPARVLSIQDDADMADGTASGAGMAATSRVDDAARAPRAAPSAIDRLMRSPAKVKQRGGPALWLAWMVSIAAVLGAVWVGYAWRDTIMDAWPPSIRHYAALRLAGAP